MGTMSVYAIYFFVIVVTTRRTRWGPYRGPWSQSISWCLAEVYRNEDQRQRPNGPVGSTFVKYFLLILRCTKPGILVTGSQKGAKYFTAYCSVQ